jgi:hypothetical protein
MNMHDRWISLGKAFALAILTFWLVIRLTAEWGMWCGSDLCHSSGFRYGLPLWVGAVALALVGRLCLSWVRSPGQADGGFRLFTSLATGLTVLMGYVYVRSMFNHLVVDVPVTRWELGALVLMAAGLLVFRMREESQLGAGAAKPRDWRLLALDLVLLLALCFLVADREMPREVMLSTDPDFHVYFGLQIERFGAVPYQQREWGPESFNYPAGSGVVLFLWHLASGLDHRNLITAIPVLFTFLGALVVAEGAMGRLGSRSHRLIVQLSVVTVTAASLMFPLYSQIAHMQGVARQMSILFVALFLSAMHARFAQKADAGQPGDLVVGLVLFVMCILNPANIVVPGGLLFALTVYRACSGHLSFRPAGVLVTGVGLLALDPYYQGMLNIVRKARTDTVGYDDSFAIKPWSRIVEDALQLLTQGSGNLVFDMLSLIGERPWPFFLILVVPFSVCLLAVSRRWPRGWAGWVAVAAFLVSLFLVYVFAMSLANDRRFYLLGPYVQFNMSQHKAMLLVFLIAAVLSGLAVAKVHRLWMLVAAACLVTPVNVLVRGHQDMLLDPRRDYCGALSCYPEEDLRLLRRFEAEVKKGSFVRSDRVLLPNAPAQMSIEKWIFPVSSARAYPMYDVLPAAFFYYQGDVEYSTASYMQRVCNQLNREWLESKRIRYVFLPSLREGVCLKGIEDLVSQEQIVLQEGNAYLLKLAPTSLSGTPGR